MEAVDIIWWGTLATFLLFFYLYEIKKIKAFAIPAHLTLLIAVLLHAIFRDWHIAVKIIIVVVAIIGIIPEIYCCFTKKE